MVVAAVGFFVVIGSLACYQIMTGAKSVIGTNMVPILEEISYVTLCLVVAGLGLTFIGVTGLLRKIDPQGNEHGWTSHLKRISWAIADRRSASIFLLSGAFYALIFGIVSGTMVFEPGIIFSKVYGVRVPSVVAVVCCGPFGQMPQLVVYITENFALQIIPSNLALLLTVSWLVGLNAATARRVYSLNRELGQRGWTGSIGAFIGLFTVCPTCAGFSLLTLIGLSGSIALPVTLSWLQLVFVLATIPILVATPILVLREIPDSACKLDRQYPSKSSVSR